MQRNKVVLPQPEGPSNVRKVPGSMVRLTLLTAMTLPNRLLKFLMTMEVPIMSFLYIPRPFLRLPPRNKLMSQLPIKTNVTKMRMTAFAICVLPFSL